jgi:hypothetical protein
MEGGRIVQSGDSLKEPKHIPFELDVDHVLARGEMIKLRGA